MEQKRCQVLWARKINTWCSVVRVISTKEIRECLKRDQVEVNHVELPDPAALLPKSWPGLQPFSIAGAISKSRRLQRKKADLMRCEVKASQVDRSGRRYPDRYTRLGRVIDETHNKTWFPPPSPAPGPAPECCALRAGALRTRLIASMPITAWSWRRWLVAIRSARVVKYQTRPAYPELELEQLSIPWTSGPILKNAWKATRLEERTRPGSFFITKMLWKYFLSQTCYNNRRYVQERIDGWRQCCSELEIEGQLINPVDLRRDSGRDLRDEPVMG